MIIPEEGGCIVICEKCHKSRHYNISSLAELTTYLLNQGYRIDDENHLICIGCREDWPF